MTVLSSAAYEADGEADALELCYRNGWTDGLPVVPPTEERVRRMLAAVPREPAEVLGVYRERGRQITLEKVAINAVMAGCLPEYLPLVVAIVEVLLDPRYDFHAANASTGSPALGFIVNGPIRDAIGMNYQGNVLGPGNRANATIGRALRLLQINAFGSVPGAGLDEASPLPILDRATLGQPGKYAGFHLPEYEEAYPDWPPLHVERGFARDQNVVTVFATGGGLQISLHVEQRAEQIAETVAHQLAHLGRNTGQGWLVLALTPEAARIVVRDGWSRAQLREAIYARATRSTAWLKQNGWSTGGFLHGALSNAPLAPGDELQQKSVVRGPDDIYLVVAGGPAGAWAYVLLPYGPIAAKAF
ncbi:MAG TPA: hypothetical protein VFD32_02385 [Dehalococcoidia bacterium]|nr:hypothetical protein [Dehalococcoidia bacterium]